MDQQYVPGTMSARLANALRDFDFANIMLSEVWPDAPGEMRAEWQALLLASSIRLREIGLGVVTQIGRAQALKLRKQV